MNHTPQFTDNSRPTEIITDLEKKPLERFKAYADGPDKVTKNKYIVYPTHDVDHSINLLERMVRKGWKIRSAFHEFEDKRSVRIDKAARKEGLI